MSRILVIFAIVIFLLNCEIESIPLPLPVMKQYIEPLPGFIPVYIREGDTPLEDINDDLAEAFESYAIKNARLPIIKPINNNDITQHIDEKKKTNQKKKFISNDNHGIHAIQVVIQQEPQHIQKIPIPRA